MAKKRSVVLWIACLFTFVANAQEQDSPRQMPPEQRAKNRVEKLYQKVPSLPVAKKDSMVRIFTDFAENMQTYRTEGNADALKAIEQSRDLKVKQLLNNDTLYADYQKYLAGEKAEMEKRREEFKQNGRGGGGGRRGGGGRHGGGQWGGGM